jgi:hypothetical protein
VSTQLPPAKSRVSIRAFNELETFQKDIGVDDFSIITTRDFSVVIIKRLDFLLNNINLVVIDSWMPVAKLSVY